MPHPRIHFRSSKKKERLFVPLLIIPFSPAKIAVVFFGDGEGSKKFHKASFLTLLSNPSFYWMGVGKHYLNRTSVLENLLSDSSHVEGVIRKHLQLIQYRKRQ